MLPQLVWREVRGAEPLLRLELLGWHMVWVEVQGTEPLQRDGNTLQRPLWYEHPLLLDIGKPALRNVVRGGESRKQQCLHRVQVWANTLQQQSSKADPSRLIHSRQGNTRLDRNRNGTQGSEQAGTAGNVTCNDMLPHRQQAKTPIPDWTGEKFRADARHPPAPWVVRSAGQQLLKFLLRGQRQALMLCVEQDPAEGVPADRHPPAHG
jgi:hypothetical protein